MIGAFAAGCGWYIRWTAPVPHGSSDGADIVQSSSAQVVAPCLQSGAKKIMAVHWLSKSHVHFSFKWNVHGVFILPSSVQPSLISPSQAEFDSRSFPTNSARPPQRGWVNVGSRGHAAKIGENPRDWRCRSQLVPHGSSSAQLWVPWHMIFGRLPFWNVMNWRYFGHTLDIFWTYIIHWTYFGCFHFAGYLGFSKRSSWAQFSKHRIWGFDHVLSLLQKLGGTVLEELVWVAAKPLLTDDHI